MLQGIILQMFVFSVSVWVQSHKKLCQYITNISRFGDRQERDPISSGGWHRYKTQGDLMNASCQYPESRQVVRCLEVCPFLWLGRSVFLLVMFLFLNVNIPYEICFCWCINNFQ